MVSPSLALGADAAFFPDLPRRADRSGRSTAESQSSSGYFSVDESMQLVLVIEDPTCLVLVSRLSPTGCVGRIIAGELGEARGYREAQWVSAAGLLIAFSLHMIARRTGVHVALSYPALEPEPFKTLALASGALQRTAKRVEPLLTGEDFSTRASLVRAELSRLCTLKVSGSYQTPKGRGKAQIVQVHDQTFQCSVQGHPLDTPRLIQFQTHGHTTSIPFLPIVHQDTTTENLPNWTNQRVRDEVQNFQLPSWIRASGGRSAHRGPPTSPLSASWQHPIWPEVLSQGNVVNISAMGLCLRTMDAALLPPGLQFFIELTGIQGNKTRVFVRVVHTRVETNDGFIGLRVESSRPVDLVPWSRLLQAHLYSELSVSGPELWDMYEKSGYFALSGKNPADFKDVRSAFISCAKQLADTPELACMRRWPSTGPAKAAIAHTRIYQNTWCLYQVAKVRTKGERVHEGRQALYRLYLQAYEHVLACGDANWLWSFVQEHASPWSLLFHRDAPAQWLGSASYIYRFRAIEVQVTATPEPSAVHEASKIEHHAIVKHLQKTRPPAYLGALDLGDEADFSRTRLAWSKCGMQRERKCMVVERKGEAVMAIVLEIAPPGLHLYGLFDSMRTFLLGAVVNQEDIQHALSAAKSWFTTQQRTKFIWHLEDEIPKTTCDAALKNMPHRNLGAAVASIIPVDKLPILLDLLHAKIKEI